MSDYYGRVISCLELDLAGDYLYKDQVYSAEALKKDIFKKYVSSLKDDAEERGLNKFLAVNSRCKSFSLSLESESDKELVGEAKSFLYRFLLDNGVPNLTLGEILSRGKVGPGASLKAWGTDFYTKLFSSSISATKRVLYDVYKRHFHFDQRWKMAEILRHYSFGDPVIVPGNRLSFVPKSNDICRTICTEPTLNMFYQLGLGDWIVDRLRLKVGNNLSDQQFINRRLARIGSRTGSFSTIDLSSASDSLSRKMIAEMFPRDFVAWLDLFRSPSSLLPNGSSVELHMVSTMGNGFTFPLQTLLFTACVISAFRHCGLTPRFRKGNKLPNLAVFGDDIIVPTIVAGPLIRLLTLLGFEVNGDKTFLEGPFRESCGGDYLSGRLVRPVHILNLGTPQERIVAINRLNEWTAQTGIPLRNCVQYLLGTVPFRPVPINENMDAGIRVPLSLAGRLPRSKRCQSPIYRRWVASSQKLRVTDEVLGPRRARKRIFNPYGLWITFLRGDLQRDVIPVRGNVATRYSTKSSVVPNWDYETTKTLRQGFGGRLSLIAAVTLNLEQV